MGVGARRGAARGDARRSAPSGSTPIAFASQLDGLVAVDRACEPVRPAMIWMDRRADAECDIAAACIDPARLREISGCNLDASHVAAKIAWLCSTRPRPSSRPATRTCCPGAYVAFKASGVLAIDPSNASSTMLLDVREPHAGRARRATRSTSTRRGCPRS